MVVERKLKGREKGKTGMGVEWKRTKTEGRGGMDIF